MKVKKKKKNRGKLKQKRTIWRTNGEKPNIKKEPLSIKVKKKNGEKFKNNRS